MITRTQRRRLRSNRDLSDVLMGTVLIALSLGLISIWAVAAVDYDCHIDPPKKFTMLTTMVYARLCPEILPKDQSRLPASRPVWFSGNLGTDILYQGRK